jgi:macrolide resistance protein
MNPAQKRLFGVIAAGALGRLAEGLAGVALIWLVMQRGDGAADLGLLGAVAAAAFVVSSLYGGALVDRFGPRPLSVACILLSALPVAALAFWADSPALTLPLILGLVLLAQLPDGATASATDTCLPDLAQAAGVPLEKVNAADDLIDGAAAIAGAPLAGLLIAWHGIETTLWVVVALATLAAVLCGFFVPSTPAQAPAARIDTFAGVRFILGQRSVLALVLLASTLVAVFQCLDDVILPVMVSALGRQADALGIVLGCAGAGGVIGALLYLLLGERLGVQGTSRAATALIAAAVIAIAAWPRWWMLLAGAFAAGVGAGAISPLISTHLQRCAPPGLRGGVLGAASGLALALTPAATVLAGYAVDAFGSRAVVVALVIPLLAALWIATRVRVRK